MGLYVVEPPLRYPAALLRGSSFILSGTRRTGAALPDDRAAMCIPKPCAGKEAEGIEQGRET